MDISTLLDGSRGQIIKLLRNEPLTVQDLCDKLDLSPTAVREQIYNLKSKNLIEENRIRQGPGRPVHEYSLTDHAAHDKQDIYRDLIESFIHSLLQKSGCREETSSVMTGMFANLLEKQGGVTAYLNRIGVSYNTEDKHGNKTVIMMQDCPLDFLEEQEELICDCFARAIEETMDCDVFVEDQMIEGEKQRSIHMVNKPSP